MNRSAERMPAEARRRGLLLIWGAQLFSLALLFGLTYVVRPEASTDGNHTLAWTLGAVGVRRRSHSRQTRSKSRAISARTFWARLK